MAVALKSSKSHRKSDRSQFFFLLEKLLEALLRHVNRLNLHRQSHMQLLSVSKYLLMRRPSPALACSGSMDVPLFVGSSKSSFNARGSSNAPFTARA